MNYTAHPSQINQPSDPNPHLDAALEYAEAGYPVFPCRPGRKIPATQHGHLDATLDPDKIRDWWSKDPALNIGIAATDLVVLDVDGGTDNPWLTLERRESLETTAGAIAETPGGLHYICRADTNQKWRCSTSTIAANVDVRADGGYIVAAPSVVGDREYKWLKRPPPRVDLPEPPNWLQEALDQRTARRSPSAPDSSDAIPLGQRNDTLASLAGTMRCRGMSKEAIEAALQAENTRRCHPPLPPDEVATIARSISRYPRAADAQRPSTPKSPVAPYRPFPAASLPEPIRSFVIKGAEAIGCDLAYIVLPLLCCLASAIGATRRIVLKPGWTEPCVLWAILIGRSGSLKSPAWNLATQFLLRFQEFRLEQLPIELEQYEQDKLGYEVDLARWKKKGRANGEPPPEKPQEPQPARIVVSDTTTEALADRLAFSRRGVINLIDEAGAWLHSFDAYKKNRGGDIFRWLSMHRAESILVDRKSQPPILIKRAAVCITGTMTPTEFQKAMEGANERNGLLSRLLIALPPVKPKRWTDATVPTSLHDAVKRIFARLLALDFEVDHENDGTRPVDVTLDSEAFALWKHFYNAFGERQADADDVLASTLAKLEGTAARLALVHHLVRHAADDPSVAEQIDAESIKAAIELTEWFAYEAERIYSTLQEDHEARQQRELAEWIDRKGGRMTVRDLQTGRRDISSAEQAEQALQALVQAGFGQWEQQPAGLRGGRPTHLFLSAVCTTLAEPEENGRSGDGAVHSTERSQKK